jgi:hypothetical protein
MTYGFPFPFFLSSVRFAMYRRILLASEGATLSSTVLSAGTYATGSVAAEWASASFGGGTARSTVSENASSWRTKPEFGRTIARRARTNAIASGACRCRVQIRYAHTTVALRLDARVSSGV